MRKVVTCLRYGKVIVVSLCLSFMVVRSAQASIFSDIWDGVVDTAEAVIKVGEVAVPVLETTEELTAASSGPDQGAGETDQAFTETPVFTQEGANQNDAISQNADTQTANTTEPIVQTLDQVAQPDEYVEDGQSFSTTSANTTLGTDVLTPEREKAALTQASNATTTGTVASNKGWKPTPSALEYEAQYKTSAAASSTARAPAMQNVAERHALSGTEASKLSTDNKVSTAGATAPPSGDHMATRGLNNLFKNTKVTSVELHKVSSNTSGVNSQFGTLNSTALRAENDTTGRQLRANAVASQPGAEVDKKSPGG